MATHDRNEIPVKLNLLRESMEDGDLAIGTYTIGYLRYHCLCPNEDAEMLDLGGALEDTLHTLEEHDKFSEDDIREIMGLEFYTDDDVQDFEAENPGAYIPIDHGWLLHPEAMSFEVIPPEECSAALREEFTEAQIERGVHALEGDTADLHWAIALMGRGGSAREEQAVSLKDEAKAAREASAELADDKAADAPSLDQNR